MATRARRRPRKINPQLAAIGARIRAAREAAALSRAKLSVSVGVDASTLQRWEKGWFEPGAVSLRVIAGECRVSDEWLLTGVGRGPASVAA